MSVYPTISIVIPGFNHGHYIKQCFSAILNQKVLPDELIFIDNNSTDNTWFLVNKYKKIFNSKGMVFVVGREKRQGQGYARQLGYSLVSSDLIGTLDVDSVIVPNWVEIVKKEFCKDEKLGCLSGRCYFKNWSILANIPIYIDFVVFGLIRPFFQFWGCNAVFRKDIYDGFGGIDGYFEMKNKLKLKYEYDDTYLSEMFKRTGCRLKVGMNVLANVVANSDLARQKDQFVSLFRIKKYFAN